MPDSVMDPWPIEGELEVKNGLISGPTLQGEAVVEHLTEHPEGNILSEIRADVMSQYNSPVKVNVTVTRDGSYTLTEVED